MITNLNQILYDIDLEIDDIDLYGYDIIETSLSINSSLNFPGPKRPWQ